MEKYYKRTYHLLEEDTLMKMTHPDHLAQDGNVTGNPCGIVDENFPTELLVNKGKEKEKEKQENKCPQRITERLGPRVCTK